MSSEGDQNVLIMEKVRKTRQKVTGLKTNKSWFEQGRGRTDNERGIQRKGNPHNSVFFLIHNFISVFSNNKKSMCSPPLHTLLFLKSLYYNIQNISNSGASNTHYIPTKLNFISGGWTELEENLVFFCKSLYLIMLLSLAIEQDLPQGITYENMNEWGKASPHCFHITSFHSAMDVLIQPSLFSCPQ